MNIRLRTGIAGAAIMLLMAILLGCSANPGIKDESAPARPVDQKIDQKKIAATAADNRGGVSPQAEVEKKIIESATLGLETSKPEDLEKMVLALIAERQGDVNNINISLTGSGLRHGAYTLRIPQGKLKETVDAVSSLPNCVVRHKNISAQDVTEEYIDVNARLENMRRQEVRLREILNRAATVDEILKVENELTRVRTQLESAQAKLKAMNNRIEMSTIHLTIREVSLTAAPGFGGKLIGALNEGMEMAGETVLGTIVFAIGLLPLIVLGALVWLGRHKIKALIQGKKAAKQDQIKPPSL
ncbi:DUF4349 domain-containing protein [Acetonema longum]|uniref:Putative transmembrane anti-sigma factor n=1 Tax=Acetonema longum DSM 6540 TaxID=1009370 RepID=F7NJQ1_9FIRM|nr:DUF4349 domain-containing protein [Acetonema longum]EGO63707.1 putative transmembrane anti-sigma factor [Acetonema longum DSM 6540]